MSRLKDLEPADPVRRYERKEPGELIHLDIKKLGRFNEIGHRITGDRRKQSSRRGSKKAVENGARVGICPCPRSTTPRACPSRKIHARRESRERRGPHLKAAVAWYESLGVTVSVRHDRQRLLLHIKGLRQRVPASA